MQSCRRKAFIRTLGTEARRPIRLLTATLLVLGSSTAWAQLYDLPYADASYQYNSNIFALPYDGTSTNQLEERAGVKALYDWSLQELYANIEGRHFSYSGLGQLDHSEYLVHGGLQWKLASLFDGVVDYRRERSMVNFIEFQGATNTGIVGGQTTELFLQTDSLATASINLNIGSDWRWLNEGQIHNLDSPRPGFPSLSLTENSVLEGIRYLGVSKLSAGIDAIYLSGHFDNDEFVGSPHYNDKTIEAAAHYKATGLSTFDGTAGYTQRNQGAGSASGTTGSLAYTRNLTGKTAINLKLYRAVNSYVTYGGAEIDTGFNIGAQWNATERISVSPGYGWLYSAFPGTIETTGTGQRADHYQLATLQVKYQIRDWISIRPFGQYEARRSSLDSVSFNRSEYGVELEIRLAHDADKEYHVNLPPEYTIQ